MKRRLIAFGTAALLIGLTLGQDAPQANDDISRATPVTLDSRIESVIAPNQYGGGTEQFYVLELGAADGDTRFDAVLAAGAADYVEIAQLAADGTQISYANGEGEVRLTDYVLGAGKHILRIRGSWDEGEQPPHFTLSFQKKGQWQSGEEREPNFDLARATVIPIDQIAKGVLTDDNDRDFISFEVKAPAQLWRIAASGDGMDHVTLRDAAGRDLKRVVKDPTLGDAQMWTVLLPPGLARLEVNGSVGPWEVRATPIGPAPLEVLGGQVPARGDGQIDEIEPNNGVGEALILPLGGSRAGQIEGNEDADMYRFTLEGETRVRLTLKGVIGMRLRAGLTRSENGGFELIRPTLQNMEGETGSLSSELMLSQGDYYVWVLGDRREEKPYELRLERLPYFTGSADLEPNDSVYDLRPVPPSLVIDGVMLGDEQDFFRLPALDHATTLTLTFEEMTEGLQPRVGILKQSVHLNGPIEYDWAGAPTDFTRDESGKIFTTELEAGDQYLLRLAYGRPGPYRVRLAFSGGPEPVAEAETLKASLTLASDAAAAFSDDHQRISGTLTLTNSASTAVDAVLAFHPGDDRWAVEGAPATLRVEPGASAEAAFTLVAAPQLFDGGTTTLSVEARSGPLAASVEAQITARLDAAAISPERRFALPDALLGGVNVAWSVFGATVPEGREALIDGYATLGTAERLNASDAPEEVMVVTLPGEAPQTLLGITLNPTIGPDIANQVRAVAVEASADGTNFTRVFEGIVPSRQREYAFPFAAPVTAKFLRVLPLGAQLPRSSSPIIGEFKAIADVSVARGLAPEGFNLADPVLGGYLVSVSPVGYTADRFLDDGESADAVHFNEKNRDFSWTISFRNQRAARLARIDWIDVPDFDPEQAIDAVDIETAMELTGPWQKAGRWTLDRSSGTPSPFAFAPGTWARFVRFSVPLPPHNPEERTRYYRGPRQIRIIEVPPDATGGTILGEWGDIAREGPYERAHPETVVADTAERRGGASREAARVLTPDKPEEGRASAGSGSQWWSVDVPEGGLSLTLTLTGHPGLGVKATILDAGGETVPASVERDDGHVRIATAKVSPGHYYIQVEEPPRSIAITWDTSGSVSPYIATIMQSVRGFVRYLNPGRDEVQLLPFQEPESTPLLEAWTGDATTAFAALSAYDWNANSSNGEGGVIGAANALAERPGSRAIIVVTDFQTGRGYDQRNEALEQLGKTGAQVFGVAIPSDSGPADAAIERSLMRTFASASNGVGLYAGTPGELEQVFARTAATLRAPKDYTILASIGFKPPEPGFVEVKAPERADPAAPVPVSKDRGVLVILDASGSMLKKLGKKRRIDIAKETLTKLTQEMLPEGVPFAMRVFGDTKKGSCDTNLRLPMAPLDRAAAKAAVDKLVSINGAKTAIGASLAAAASDVGGGAGQKLIILITDGEETCEGDPLKEIEALRASGIEARVSIVGFAVEDAALKDTFASWAQAGGGGYFDATRPEEIAPAVQAALAPTYEVRAADGGIAAVGVVGAGPVEVPPGDYVLHIFVEPPEDHPITIESGGTVSVTMNQ